MEYKAKDYQLIAIDHIIDNPKAGLFLKMGLGKTVSTLTALNDLMFDWFSVRNVLVVAPKLVAVATWPNEIAKWDHLEGMTYSVITGTAKQREQAVLKEARIHMINRENVVWLVQFMTEHKIPWKWDTLVIDELSSFKDSGSKRFRALRKVQPFFHRVIGLTGTPAAEGYEKLWPQVYLLDRGERLGKTLTEYRNNYFSPGRRNGHVIYEWKLRKDSKRIIDQKLSDICISMDYKDWLPMEDPEIIDVPITMSASERKLYDTMAKECVLEFENSEAALAVNAAVLQSKLLQLSSGFIFTTEDHVVQRIHTRKLDALLEIIEAAQGEPVMVVYGFIPDRDLMLEAIPGAEVMGQGDEMENADRIRRWNAGEIPVLLLHPRSAGHGLNLQDGGHILVWYTPTWSLEEYQQTIARLHRQGQKKKVLVYRLLGRDTADELAVWKLGAKDVTQEALMEALKAHGGRR